MLSVSSGYDVQGFSFYQHEAEVLLPPGLSFEVVGHMDLGSSLFVVQLQQVAPHCTPLHLTSLEPVSANQAPLRFHVGPSRATTHRHPDLVIGGRSTRRAACSPPPQKAFLSPPCSPPPSAPGSPLPLGVVISTTSDGRTPGTDGTKPLPPSTELKRSISLASTITGRTPGTGN